MTMRQVHACLERIRVRTKNEFAMTAGLHGVEMKLETLDEGIDSIRSFSQEEKSTMSKSIKGSLERIIKEKNKK